jgi:hypothetical protein
VVRSGKQFQVQASFTLYADDEREAQRVAASCVELWDDDKGIDHVSGVGLAKGTVSIYEVTPETVKELKP